MKVYISKSNNGNPDLLAKVRHELKKIKGIEIIEFKGGKYTNKPLINSDFVVVIPPDEDEFVGKGQYFQIHDCFNHKDSKVEDVVLVVSSGEDKLIKIKNITGIEINDEEDWTWSYGRVNANGAEYSLPTVIHLELDKLNPPVPAEPKEIPLPDDSLCNFCEENLIQTKGVSSNYLCEGSHCDEAQEALREINLNIPDPKEVVHDGTTTSIPLKKEVKPMLACVNLIKK